MKLFSYIASLLAISMTSVMAQTGPGSAACTTCLAACKANPSGVSQDCVDACNKNLQCNATIVTSTVGTSTESATYAPTSTNGAQHMDLAFGMSAMGILGAAIALI